MGSVNANAPATLPTTPTTTSTAAQDAGGWDFADGVTAMGHSLGSTMTDAASFAGVATDDDGSLRAGVDPAAFGGFAAATAGPTAIMALRNRVDPLTGATTSYVDRLGATATSNSIRVTPTLVSAIAGPAIADGITMIAPNLVKKHKDLSTIKDATAKKAAERDNQMSSITRAVAGGAAVGLAAGAAFLIKPSLFKNFGVNFVSDGAIQGLTKYATSAGRTGSVPGVMDATQIGQHLAKVGKPLLDSESVNVLKTTAPMAKDAAFSNRAVLGSAGGLGTLMLADKAAGEDDPERKRLLMGLTAAAGALTVGGAYGIGKLTQRSQLANGGAGGLLAKNDLMWKPNLEWFKSYGTKIAPITAIPAGTAASQYFNIVDDFDDITSSRSPFRK